MATGRTPDASETKRAEDSTRAGYDKKGKVKIFRTDELRGGQLPEGYTDKPPEDQHPNVKASKPPADAAAEREAELERRERELDEREAAANRPTGGGGGGAGSSGGGAGGKPK